MPRKSLRGELVAAATEQFHTLGYHAAGVKTIADAAHAPKGSFYNHFESKEALAVLALEEYGRTRRIPELLDTSVDPLQRLRAHFQFLREENLAHAFRRGCLVGDLSVEVADSSEPVRAAAGRAFANWRDAIASAVGNAQQAGLVSRAVDADTLARFVLNAWEGTLIAARVERTARPYEAFFTLVFDTLLT
ncbi:TetR/AcrR family transcriptional regulator [Actinacidiphila guanduensis]|uniref:Transcriptional regulator, TetR family n=1 Tax=Actinacidiphila guanduensis TaxID=310781 RepID=A0A1H0Q0Z8_9ACTN|nr:TetR/AcrR family transcriptional regulator [Actinacidiphila guanduensis]SDP11127.1 transcriptional regulator, TetR family [Actinacidiphila guanduensis]